MFDEAGDTEDADVLELTDKVLARFERAARPLAPPSSSSE